MARWILRPRHWRRLWCAARRVGFCEERDLLDEWMLHDLRRVKREALAAGMNQDDVDDAIMDGMAAGRLEASE